MPSFVCRAIPGDLITDTYVHAGNAGELRAIQFYRGERSRAV